MREALHSRLALAGPTKKILETLAAHTPDHTEREKIAGLLAPEAKEQIAFADRILLNKIDLVPREKLLAYAETHGIPIEMKHKKGGSPYSMDANLLHISYEGGILEDPNFAPEENMWRLTVSPEKAPNKPQVIELTYKHGDVVAIDRAHVGEAQLLKHGAQLGHRQALHALLEVLQLGGQLTVHERQVLDRLLGQFNLKQIR